MVTEGATTDQWPGPGHKAVFDGVKDTNCTVDISEVADLDIQAGYSGVISLPLYNSGGGTGDLEVTNSFRMAGGSINNVGDPNGTGEGRLSMTGQSVFTWSGGKISRTSIVLSSSVTGSITNWVDLNRSSLENYGHFTWANGNILVPQGLSSITNHAGGTFVVQTSSSVTVHNGSR